MKKLSFFAAIFAVLAFIFSSVISCDNGNDNGTTPNPESETFTLVQEDSFQWEHGYKRAIDALDYFSGKIIEGDEFTIKFKVSASRDLEDQLIFGMIDATPEALWWGELTPWYSDKGITNENRGTILTAGQEIEITQVMTAIDTANGLPGNKTANKIYFITNGRSKDPACDENCVKLRDGIRHLVDENDEYNTAAIGSGKEGPVTLTFKDFELKRKGEAHIELCKGCKQPLDDCTCTIADMINGDTIIKAVKLTDDNELWDANAGYSYSFTINAATPFLVLEFHKQYPQLHITFRNDSLSYNNHYGMPVGKTKVVFDLSGEPKTEGVNMVMFHEWNESDYTLRTSIKEFKFYPVKPMDAYEFDMTKQDEDD